MFARRYFPGRYFPQTYFPQSQGEEAEIPVVIPSVSGGGRIYPYPQDKPKKRKVIRQPLPEYEISGPLSKQTAIEHTMLPDWDMESWEASLKTLAYLETEQKVRKQRNTESLLLLWMA